MQICPECFNDMTMVNKPKTHFACEECGYKDETWVEVKKIDANSSYSKIVV